MKASALVACLLVLGVAHTLGIWAGRQHPGQVLVPAAAGTPADLPGWACTELVRYRFEELERRVPREARGLLHAEIVDLGGGHRVTRRSWRTGASVREACQ